MMKKNRLPILIASGVATAFLNGCTGQEVAPNNATQTGVAVGALTGAVIGYNSGSHSGRNAAAGAALGALAGGALGGAVDSSNPAPVQSGGWQ